ncbi:MAG: hypothetical protein WCZ65_12945 [Lysobacteraceae bacterium]
MSQRIGTGSALSGIALVRHQLDVCPADFHQRAATHPHEDG